MNYEELLIYLTDTTAQQAYNILYENPNNEYKKGYELIISKNALYSYLYALMRGRFELGEEVIKNSIYKKNYAKFVMKNPNFWSET